ncbi:MAG: dihydroorotate dehydrogenase, partial [Anaerolineae bacterium]
MSPPGADLAVEIAGVRFATPLILASGILGTDAAVMERVARAGAAGITSKSAGPRPRRGHPNPSCVDWGPGLLNAIGLANPGADAEVEVLAAARRRLAPLGVPLIASVFAASPAEFARVAATVAEAEPDLLELNVSCPNVASEVGEPFAAHPEGAAAVTRAVRAAVDLPLVVKLAPNVPDLGAIARAVQEAGADAICAINTMPGMLIDIESGRPVLANGEGGVSGAALGPVAVRAVFEIARAVDLPIIGTGGVASGADALEMIMAGATAVGIGSAVYGEGMAVFGRVADEMSRWLAERGMTLADARGRAHRQPVPRAPGPPGGNTAPPRDPRQRQAPWRRQDAGAAGMVRTKALPAPARVAAVRRENRRTVTVTLDAATLAQPGQVAMLWLPGRDEKPFSFL